MMFAGDFPVQQFGDNLHLKEGVMSWAVGLLLVAEYWAVPSPNGQHCNSPRRAQRAALYLSA